VLELVITGSEAIVFYFDLLAVLRHKFYPTH